MFVLGELPVMSFAMWAYPWDILDEGVEQVTERLLNIGVTEINLATNYHAVQTFNPHNPERRTFFAHASSYFQPDGAYGQLRPVPNETMGEDDWLSRIDDAIADTAVDLSSWTIGCHNSQLGMNNPDLTIRNPYGDPLVFGLCPSQPEVQEYLIALLSDLDSRGSFSRIELETFDYFYGTGFGWHHDKFHTRLGRLGKFLFGLCFCDVCRANANDVGIDVERARTECIETIDAIAAGELPFDLNIAGWLADHGATEAYARNRCETLTALYDDLADSVGSSTELGCYVGMFGVDDAWQFGKDLGALADPLDYQCVIAYEDSRDEAIDRVNTARSMTDSPLHAGVTPGHPVVYNEETVVDVVSGLWESGVERISFYNYGLLPKRNLDWIESATAPYR